MLFQAVDLACSKMVLASDWSFLRVCFLSLKEGILWASVNFFEIIWESSLNHQHCEEETCGVLGSEWGMDCLAEDMIRDTNFSKMGFKDSSVIEVDSARYGAANSDEIAESPVQSALSTLNEEKSGGGEYLRISGMVVTVAKCG